MTAMPERFPRRGHWAYQMSGGVGDDTYAVDSLSDVIAELTGEGLDRVDASVTYTIGAGVED